MPSTPPGEKIDVLEGGLNPPGEIIKVNHLLVNASPMSLADLSDRSLGLEAQYGAPGQSCGAVHPP